MKVTVSPVAPPAALIVGVLSLVLLSVDDEPVSEPESRSRSVGATAVASIDKVGPDVGGETFPAKSVNVARIFQSPSARFGRSQPVA